MGNHRRRLERLEEEQPPLPDICWSNLWARTPEELQPDAQGTDWWLAFRSGQLPSKYRDGDPVEARIAAVKALAKPAVTKPTTSTGDGNV